jgi:hypothetical protein
VRIFPASAVLGPEHKIKNSTVLLGRRSDQRLELRRDIAGVRVSNSMPNLGWLRNGIEGNQLARHSSV